MTLRPSLKRRKPSQSQPNQAKTCTTITTEIILKAQSPTTPVGATPALELVVAGAGFGTVTVGNVLDELLAAVLVSAPMIPLASSPPPPLAILVFVVVAAASVAYISPTLEQNPARPVYIE